MIKSATSNPVPQTPSSIAAMPDRFLRLQQVIERAGLGKTMIYRKVRDGTFPQPFKPGGASTRWSEREIMEWQEARLAQRVARVA
jgi:prophage regulatory protein